MKCIRYLSSPATVFNKKSKMHVVADFFKFTVYDSKLLKEKLITIQDGCIQYHKPLVLTFEEENNLHTLIINSLNPTWRYNDSSIDSFKGILPADYPFTDDDLK